jgi:hypothetical protein
MSRHQRIWYWLIVVAYMVTWFWAGQLSRVP